MPLLLGNTSVTKIYLGTKEVQRIYLGSTQVYGRQWTPADISTLGWYDAADSSTITLNGSTVSQWDDKSGNVRHLTQPTAVKQPLYEAIGYNGLPTLTFDGVDDTYINNNVALAIGGNDFIMFLVCRTTSITNSFQLCTVGQDGRLYVQRVSSQMEIRWGSNPSVQQSFNVGTGENHLLSWSRTNTNTVQAYTDGTLQATGSATFNRAFNNFSLHSYSFNGSSSSYGNGSTCELVIAPPLSTADRERVEGYLAHKWGLSANLPADHPYKNAAPTI